MTYNIFFTFSLAGESLTLHKISKFKNYLEFIFVSQCSQKSVNVKGLTYDYDVMDEDIVAPPGVVMDPVPASDAQSLAEDYFTLLEMFTWTR